MTFLVVHGYYLQGASSNLFVYHTCKSLIELGHDVILVCQETDYWSYDIISEVWNYDNEQECFHNIFKRETSFKGTCSLYRPSIGDVLPVFIYEAQTKFVTKEMSFTPDKDIETYISNNVMAINTVCSHHPIDVIWSHHCVLQPFIVASLQDLSRDVVRIATIHGSGLQCIQKKSSLKTYAIKGLEVFDTICFTSKDIQKELVRILEAPEELTASIDIDEWKKKMCVISPGVDIQMFHPMTKEETKPMLIKDILQHAKTHSQIGPQLITEEHFWETDVLELFRLHTVDTHLHPLLLYYGRYLWTKGIQMIAIAIPLILQKCPNARFIFTGFGPTQTYVETLITYLHHGREELFLESIQNPDLWDAQIDRSSVAYIQSFLDWMQDPLFREKYFYAAKNEIQKSIYFTGYLDQPVLSKLIRSVDLTVFPFIVPESFGQVAIESFSSGILPLMTDYGAFSDIHTIYRDSLPSFPPNVSFKPIPLDKELIFSISRYVVDVLKHLQKMSEIDRQKLRNRLYTITSSVFSWESMIQKYMHFVQTRD